MKARLFLLLLTLPPALLAGILLTRFPPSRSGVRGIVEDESGPLIEAQVRYQGDALWVHSEENGRFDLPVRPPALQRITAWKEGYFIGGAEAKTNPVRIRLTRLPDTDNTQYEWVDPAADPAKTHNCANCHAEIYREWAVSSHARSATNRHFRDMHGGGAAPGGNRANWNFLAEHPLGAGVCTACHAPSVAPGDPAYVDPRKAQGVAAQGVHCDYCHKVVGIQGSLDGRTHGRFGLKLLRPSHGQLFFGPLDDVDRGEDSFSPLYKESRYCASCHEGTIFGVHAYGTYSEWLESPARRQGKQCQTCHMTPSGTMTNIAPGRGGIERHPGTLASHGFPGSARALLSASTRLELQSERIEGAIRAQIQVTARDIGHRLPTGFPDRHVLLIAQAWDAAGKELDASAGPRLPAKAGSALAGKAGELFAKHQRDAEGEEPAPFWRAQAAPVDNRLRPDETVRVNYDFPEQTRKLRVRLVYRRFWQEVADAKGWTDNEVLIEEVEREVGP